MSGEGAPSGKLFVVATPIGNLADLTPRAAEALREADLVAAEDTRRTRGLLSHLGVSGAPLRRLDANASEAEIEAVAALVLEGKRVALVTDAGTPAVSDPGSRLVAAVRARGGVVVPLPGASAVTAALSASGFELAGGYRFVGFLPRGGTERARAIAQIAAETSAVVLFEAPARLAYTLADLAAAAPARQALIARELTKLHEELEVGELGALAARWAAREVLGELTLVLAPWAAGRRELADEEVDAAIDALLAGGMRPREVAERVAIESGRSKSRVYDRVLKRRER